MGLTGLVNTRDAFANGVITRKTAVPYSPEFARQMGDLVRAGHGINDLAQEFEPTVPSIRNWIVQADKKEGRRA